MSKDGPGERFHHILQRIVLTVMPARVAESLAAACGLWSVLSPLLLWIAWSKPVFLMVLGSSIVCGCVSALLAMALAPAWRKIPPPKRPAQKRGGFGRASEIGVQSRPRLR